MSEVGRSRSPDAVRGWVTNSRIGLIPRRLPPPSFATRRSEAGKRARRSAPLRKFARHPFDRMSICTTGVKEAAPFARGLKLVRPVCHSRGEVAGEGGRPVCEGIETSASLDLAERLDVVVKEAAPFARGLKRSSSVVLPVWLLVRVKEAAPFARGLKLEVMPGGAFGHRSFVKEAAPFARGLKPAARIETRLDVAELGEGGRPVCEGIETVIRRDSGRGGVGGVKEAAPFARGLKPVGAVRHEDLRVHQ